MTLAGFMFSALLWKKKLIYAYEAATDLIRFQLHGWVQPSGTTDAPHFLSQIRETSCIHDYGEYADKCFWPWFRTIYVMQIILISVFIIEKRKLELLFFRHKMIGKFGRKIFIKKR